MVAMYEKADIRLPVGEVGGREGHGPAECARHLHEKRRLFMGQNHHAGHHLFPVPQATRESKRNHPEPDSIGELLLEPCCNTSYRGTTLMRNSPPPPWDHHGARHLRVTGVHRSKETAVSPPGDHHRALCIILMHPHPHPHPHPNPPTHSPHTPTHTDPHTPTTPHTLTPTHRRGAAPRARRRSWGGASSCWGPHPAPGCPPGVEFGV